MKMLAAVFICLLVQQSFAVSLVGFLANDPQFSTLVDLVQTAGLAGALSTGEYTVFAPTNDAFAKIPAATLNQLKSDTNALADTLKYHVVQGRVPSSAASNELKVMTLSGKQVRFNIYTHNNVITVQGSKVTAVDRTADNGIAHVIDTVMMPPTGDIVDIVAGDSRFSTLLSLVQQAGIANALKADNLTLFAPTNDAFARLSSRSTSRITGSKSLLTEILEYHVVPHTEYSQGLYDREYLRTIDRRRDVIQIHEYGNTVSANNGDVTQADIGATNGVVHVIDHVLIPARYYLTVVLGK